MKLNVSYPANGSQKIIEVDDERKLRPFMEKRMGTEVSIFPFLPSFICVIVCVVDEAGPAGNKT